MQVTTIYIQGQKIMWAALKLDRIIKVISGQNESELNCGENNHNLQISVLVLNVNSQPTHPSWLTQRVLSKCKYYIEQYLKSNFFTASQLRLKKYMKPCIQRQKKCYCNTHHRKLGILTHFTESSEITPPPQKKKTILHKACFWQYV